MALDRTPARMQLTRLDNPQTTLEAQFNPTQLEEELEVKYAHVNPIGLPHEILQYTGTGNHKVNFQLFFHANLPGIPGPQFFPDRKNRDLDPVSVNNPNNIALQDIHAARRFLLACCYPRPGNDILSSSPPRVLFCWPQVFAFTTVVNSLKFSHELFTLAGVPRQMRVDVQLEEIRDFALLTADVDAFGTQRPAGNPFDPGDDF